MKGSERLSLLLLLRIDPLPLLGLVNKLGPLFVRRKLLVGREHGLRRRDPNSNLELRVRLSLHHAHCGWNVRVISTDCGANVPLTYGSINRGIEAYPANTGEKSFHPSMPSAARRGMPIFAGMVKISTDIATGNFGISNECDHDMSKILTYSLSRPKGMRNRRTYRRVFLYVAKTAMHAGGKIVQKRQRASSIPFARADLLCETLQAPADGRAK